MLIWEHQSSGWYYRILVAAAVAAIVVEVLVDLAAIAIDPVVVAVGGIHLEIGLLQTFLVVAVVQILQEPGNQLALGIEHCQIHLAVGCCTLVPAAEPIHFAVALAEVVQTQIDRILVAFQSQQPRRGLVEVAHWVETCYQQHHHQMD